MPFFRSFVVAIIEIPFPLNLRLRFAPSVSG